jgi:hypothetical protein
LDVFGIEPWVLLAVVFSLGAVLFSLFRMQGRSWIYRLLLALGLLSLIWGVMPTLGGGSIYPFLVVGAILAFGFLVLSDSTGDGSRW